MMRLPPTSAAGGIYAMALGDRTFHLNTPHCIGMEELPSAAEERAKILKYLESNTNTPKTSAADTPLSIHLLHGLAYTTGSALGSIPPSFDTCLAAFLVPNKAGLTAGARAWSKHAHRSQSFDIQEDRGRRDASAGWWGTPSGPVATINEKAVALYRRVMDNASWRNLHWLPHQVLVYEVRVPEGYGMRWSQDRSPQEGEGDKERPWLFRGCVEPMMENGHEIGWRH